MKKFPRILPRPFSISALIVSTCVCALQLSAQSTGWNQAGGGTYVYANSANWVEGNVNGIWDASQTLTGAQTITFGSHTSLSTGLSFRYGGAFSETFRADGTGPYTLTLGGDILVQTSGNQTITFGSSSPANQALNINLGGVVRTFTVFGGGNGGNFGRTLDFRNSVSDGGVIASGGGSGGGLVRFSSASNTFSSLAVDGAEVSFNGAAVTGANTVNTISNALTAEQGANTVTLTAAGSRHTLVQAGSFSRSEGSTMLFRGPNLGVNAISSATAGAANIRFTAAPALVGGSGAEGSTTVSILAGAFGDKSATGTGFGTTGGLVTYDSIYGVRLLSASEYSAGIINGQTQLDNVRIANSSGVISTTTLSSAMTTINSLSLAVSGSLGNQGIIITGDAGSALKINSGVIYAEQNVAGSGSPASTDAMRIEVPTLDFNGQEAIILVNTRLNTGGTVVSNGGLFINSTITNATGLTIGDGLTNNPSGYVVLGGSQANSYTGNTTVNGAIVQLNKSIADSFGNIVLNLGSLYNTGNQIADTASVTINGGTFYLNGSNNSGSATNETIESLTMRNGGVSSGSGSGNTFTISGNAALSGGNLAMSQNAKLNVGGTTSLTGGVISVGGNNSLTVYNSKTTLSGPLNISNTAVGTAVYTPISIAAGTGAGNLGGQLELAGDVTFIGNSNTNTVTIAAPTGVGFQGVIALDGFRTFNIGDGAAAVDLGIQAGLVDGATAGGLSKTGAGALALTGSNTYTGATVVNAGTLLLNGSSVSAVTVNGGALGGSGGTTGSVTVGNNGVLAPGNSPGVLSTGDLSLTGANSTIAMEIAGTGAGQYDQINVTGGVNLDGNGKIEVTLLSFVPQPTDIFFLILNDGADAINGTLYGIAQGGTFDSGGYTWQVSYTGNSGSGTFTGGNDLALQVIPEPSTWLLLTGGLMAATLLRRRRHA